MTKKKAALNYLEAATRWFGRSPDHLDQSERRALARAARRQASTEDPNRLIDEQTGFGGRLADRVAAFGGSWLFISLFGSFLLGWTVLNTEILGKTAFDPYPYVFLNLVLSMLAAVQAPVILMSQNRQSAKDRQMATHDYEVNLKAEIEIMALHDKLDALRLEQLTEVIERQQKQLEQLTQMLQK
ncbi:DUF1003 domain-containing protein [Solimonas sp. SE-A11]|uniref:DUF1003 domain-containing protein n=1 Tax=Solimonas sp. SE-A11 TaxID=3054954 RepID=UPI00259CE499|nr:DUF1003 domain-containing protein [Solimonas sp. SE-A11]MDM4770471.1 DUF1003 domain-containing protein [Solimonas sp. SE-A11]